MIESPRRVDVKDGAYTDWFEPYDVHVYSFPRGGKRQVVRERNVDPKKWQGKSLVVRVGR